MSVPPELTVLLDRVVVGTLTPVPGSHLHRFRYTDRWIGDPSALVGRQAGRRTACLRVKRELVASFPMVSVASV